MNCCHLNGALAVCLLLSWTGFAQTTSERPTHIRGEIEAASLAHVMQVEVFDTARHAVIARVVVGYTGSFDFYAPLPAALEVRVLNASGDIIKTEFFTSFSISPTIRIRLDNSRKEQPISGLVTAQRLAHKIPKKALKEFDLAEKARKRNRPEESEAHLRGAIELDPDYVEAINNLATALIRAMRSAEAAVLLRRAIELDSSSWIPQLNLGIALLQLGQPLEAERLVRKALTLHPGFPPAEQLLAATLKLQGKAVSPGVAPARAFRPAK